MPKSHKIKFKNPFLGTRASSLTLILGIHFRTYFGRPFDVSTWISLGYPISNVFFDVNWIPKHRSLWDVQFQMSFGYPLLDLDVLVSFWTSHGRPVLSGALFSMTKMSSLPKCFVRKHYGDSEYNQSRPPR